MHLSRINNSHSAQTYPTSTNDSKDRRALAQRSIEALSKLAFTERLVYSSRLRFVALSQIYITGFFLPKNEINPNARGKYILYLSLPFHSVIRRHSHRAYPRAYSRARALVERGELYGIISELRAFKTELPPIRKMLLNSRTIKAS